MEAEAEAEAVEAALKATASKTLIVTVSFVAGEAVEAAKEEAAKKGLSCCSIL